MDQSSRLIKSWEVCLSLCDMSCWAAKLASLVHIHLMHTLFLSHSFSFAVFLLLLCVCCMANRPDCHLAVELWVGGCILFHEQRVKSGVGYLQVFLLFSDFVVLQVPHHASAIHNYYECKCFKVSSLRACVCNALQICDLQKPMFQYCLTNIRLGTSSWNTLCVSMHNLDHGSSLASCIGLRAFSCHNNFGLAHSCLR